VLKKTNMAPYKRQKEALRAAIYAYLAGAHHITEEVDRSQGLTIAGQKPEAIEARQVMLEADYERLLESTQSIELFVDILDEEDLYPYGSEWPREAIAILLTKVKAPKLVFEGESDLRFGFKKGFKEILTELASAIDGTKRYKSTLDHWMVLLINTAFHAGMIVAARSAENSKLYYDVIHEVEEETEPWSRYSQIGNMLDRQLSRETRRRTGLVTDSDLDL
jgi:hypothetical protein